MGCKYVYLLRLLKEDYELPHVEAFLDKDVADFHFNRDVIYYRKRGWEVDVENCVCGTDVTDRATMTRMDDDGLDRATLVLERYEIENS